MFPSVWPVVAMHALVIRRRTAANARSLLRSGVFVSGYLTSWTLFGLTAFGVLALARSAGLDTVSSAHLARYGVAPTALAAAAYQAVWLLMGVLLAIGVMSIIWMAVVSVAIAVEKLAPARWSAAASALLTAGLVALAVVALAKPSWLPGVGSAMGGMSDGRG
jgi:predicted metal-binding membrane protein